MASLAPSVGGEQSKPFGPPRVEDKTPISIEVAMLITLLELNSAGPGELPLHRPHPSFKQFYRRRDVAGQTLLR
ncbi:hypothetical protein RRG08_040605 [Elysia crispata]|uniref:Uncharacterized protein n=1 Tax=Elysia crispata TaxID=231223 RepID=A0AAE0YKI0_9GAST|nr:hypothetical protein RRG08_040605 [Elysia crispata]